MLKLVDKPDLGSGALRVWVRVPSPAPQKREVTERWPLFFCEVRSSAAAAAADCSANSSSQQPPNWATRISLRNSVPERGFSCTESTRGTVEGLLRYATHFQRHSVLKIGFYGTEGIFGTGKGLLWYAAHFPCGAGGRKTTPERTTRAQNNHRRKTTTRAQEARPQYIAADYNRVNAKPRRRLLATVPKDCSAEHKW